MSIQGIGGLIPPVVSGIQSPATQDIGAGKESKKLDFAEMFGKAIKEVDTLQKDANEKIEGVVLGGEGINTHTAMIALERADVAFQLMSSVRAKIIRAYEEVMRTPV